MRRARKNNKIVKPNVIPILDAVFIFIFFLLMSAQFLEIYEIGSDAPAVQTITEEQKDKRPPLNLTLDIDKDTILVKTGVDEKVYKTVGFKDGEYDLDLLNATLVEIKRKHVGEKSVIFRPKSKVEYKKLVWIMDSVREVKNKKEIIVAKNDKGETVETTTLFNQIIFETII